ncbi:MAG: MATE family efflux transporter [Ruminococcaceae bacterium]|nr:MATE family efflux transporter [Oscillospiraceae bacterium]
MAQVMDMTRGKPTKLMITFAFPVILTNLGQQIYQIVDAAIVGRGVGVDALAAVGCTDWIYWMILWSMQVMTGGFAIFVSRFLGSQEYEKMNRSIVISSVLSAVIALLLTVIGLLLTEPLLRMLGTPDNILDNAVSYLSTMIAGTLIVTAYNLAAAVLRAFGDSKSPLFAMIIAALLNIVLDLLFVLVFHWGVLGAALASILSQLVAFIYCIIKIFRISYVKIDKAALMWDKKLAKDILATGLPLAVQYIIVHAGGMIVQSTINTQGSSFIAGYTAVNKLYGMLECTAISLGTAYTTFTAQNYGAGYFRRVRQGVTKSIFLAIGAALILIAALLPLNRVLPQLFIDVSEPGAMEAIDVASHYLVNMILSLPILYLVYVHRNSLQSIGISMWSLISGIFETVIRVLFSKVLFVWWGTEVLFFAEPVAWLMAWLFALFPYYYYQKRRLKIEEDKETQ